MAGAYYPKIVTDGLVFCLDAGNRESYPGSGARWNDLSGLESSGTLVGSPSYSSANVGSLTFNGSTQNVTATTSLTGQRITLNIWCYPTTTGVFQTVFTNQIFDSTTTGWAIQQRNNGTFWCTVGIWGVGGETVSGITYSTNQWINLSMTYNGTTITGYKNGSLFGTTASTRTFSAGSINIGKGAVSASEYFTGNISMVQIYNRPLTAIEVSQNFNATRGRYGI
jgi:hypothetical protein